MRGIRLNQRSYTALTVQIVLLRVGPIAVDMCCIASPAGISQRQTFQVDLRLERLSGDDKMRDVGDVLPRVGLALRNTASVQPCMQSEHLAGRARSRSYIDHWS